MKAAELLLDLLFPRKCVFCSTLLEGKGDICPSCDRALPRCRGGERIQTGEFFSLCVSPLWFEGAVREAVHRFKFSGRRDYARPFGVLIARCVEDCAEQRPDLVVYAPISKKRRRERGYDQGELLARVVAGELGVPCCAVLEKIRHTPPQSAQMDEGARRANALGAYRVAGEGQVAGRRVLLVDDVVTTGSTFSECARVLRTAGAAEVTCAALARAGRKSG